MIIDRTDEQQNPQISTAVICRATVWMLFAEPIWASGHGAAQIEAGHMTAFEPTSDFANLNLNSRGRPHMKFGPAVMANFGPPPSSNVGSPRHDRGAKYGLESQSGIIRA
ncbi:hypothetical protein, partial [Acidiphilium sp. 37-64-53]|uniref:hypothetical protein n=1 Tax=Acidiphilium sp. 37-64-53 TaxID=1970299 RepID=UPI00257C53CB